ncbi:YchJ family protein [Denitrificimonas sp. JX-1]|uniref:YchJ family protein n=1 Tax=Denitrificimonas halotolerans TaxID=3098930 RepID=A0ABU5GTU7_9GAMM|nr:YchJ family protein [Denitrificimonas sp. JX-1]MDY7219058.1 YchJ family protein [Denitrificimonas sp. JX-1]
MTAIFTCPCTPTRTYQDCCGRYHTGQLASTPQTLMRARYSAFVKGDIHFIQLTTLPTQHSALDLKAITQWSNNSQWLGLEVLSEALEADQRHAWVKFIAHWQDELGTHQHHENSLFIKPAEQWYFYDPNIPLRAERNAPCPCGSTRKFKKCCAPYL